MITVISSSPRFAVQALSAARRAVTSPTLTGLLFPQRQRGDKRSIGADDAELAGAAGRAERPVAAGERLGEELRVLPGVDLPLLREIVLVVDRLHGQTGSHAPQSTHSSGWMY